MIEGAGDKPKNTTLQNDHWNSYASQWGLIGPPLRPTAEDVGNFQLAVADRSTGTGDEERVRALLLGVTPELVGMNWPFAVELTAIDHAFGMIAGVWPGRALPHNQAICGDWLRLPVSDRTFDVVVGDGSFTLFSYPDGWRAAVEAMASASREDGILVLRLFVAPDTPETVGEVFEALKLGRIGSFHAFKWRLAMALQRSPEDGVEVGEIFTAWSEAVVDRSFLVDELGWEPAVINTVAAYRGGRARYTFPTLAEIREVICERYQELACRHGTYELADRCPVIAFRLR